VTTLANTSIRTSAGRLSAGHEGGSRARGCVSTSYMAGGSIPVISWPISFIFSIGRTVRHVFTLLYKLKNSHFSIFIAAEPR
jgi:hypothetical protein